MVPLSKIAQVKAMSPHTPNIRNVQSTNPAELLFLSNIESYNTQSSEQNMGLASHLTVTKSRLEKHRTGSVPKCDFTILSARNGCARHTLSHPGNHATALDGDHMQCSMQTL